MEPARLLVARDVAARPRLGLNTVHSWILASRADAKAVRPRWGSFGNDRSA